MIARSRLDGDAARPVEHARAADNILEIAGLRVEFSTRAGPVDVLHGVDLSIRPGETIGLVGESGCGKSMTARSVMRIIPGSGRITAGDITYRRAPPLSDVPVYLDRLGDNSRQIRQIRGGDIGMIFQEPQTSLSPVHTIGSQIAEAIDLHEDLDRHAVRGCVLEALRLVGFIEVERVADSYSFELSGGMRQRAMLAMALSCRPRLLIADEPTTALDVTIQAQILQLIERLQRDSGMSVLLITHNMGVVANLADRVAVMYLGKVVEVGTTKQVFDRPQHPYTRALLRSIPGMSGSSGRQLWHIYGSVPDPHFRPAGCSFHPRCPHAVTGVCDSREPAPYVVGPDHVAACFLHEAEPQVASRMASAQAGVSGPDPRARRDTQDTAASQAPPIMTVRNLRKYFVTRAGLLRRRTLTVKAVDGVDLQLHRGETLALVGESGCGKTTTGKIIVRALEPTAGSIDLHGLPAAAEQGLPAAANDTVRLTDLSLAATRPLRRHIQMIFQDPYASLNPRMTVGQIIAEPLVCLGMGDHAEHIAIVDALLETVGLDPRYRARYPHAFSGGQRQRIGIARALVVNPQIVVADEPVSALDVSCHLYD